MLFFKFRKALRLFTSFILKFPYALIRSSRHYFVIDLNDIRERDYWEVEYETSYDTYVRTQRAKTSKRIEEGLTRSWTKESSVKLMSEYLNTRFHDQSVSGVCHGTRAGAEVAWFNTYLDGEPSVLGTDIEPSAERFENVICWDFHKLKEGWDSKFDFVYSNSLDHALQPKEALSNWLRSVKDDGIVFLEHSRGHGKLFTSKIDIWGLESEVVPYAILKLSKGAFAVTDILEPPERKDPFHLIYVITKRRH